MGRRVVCQTCGKGYDYGRNEICPRCGAYTNPGYTRTQLEEEMLRASGYDCSPDCMPRAYGGHNHEQTENSGLFGEPDRRPSASKKNTARRMRREAAEAATGARGPELADASSRIADTPKTVVITVVLAAFILIGLAVVIYNVAAARGKTPEEPYVQPEFYIASAQPYESFSAYPVQITVGDGEVLTEKELGDALPPGQICLLVDIQAESMEEDMPDCPLAPYLYFWEEVLYEYRYTEPIAFYHNLMDPLEEMGYMPVDYDDVYYRDEVKGQLVFVLPEYAVDFYLCLEELRYDRNGWFAIGVTEVEIPLAADEDADAAEDSGFLEEMIPQSPGGEIPEPSESSQAQIPEYPGLPESPNVTVVVGGEEVPL